MRLAPLWIERFKTDRMNNLHQWGVLSRMPKRKSLSNLTTTTPGDKKFTVKIR